VQKHFHIIKSPLGGLLKKAYILRCASALACSLTPKVRSAARSSRALPLNLFEQPSNIVFFNNPILHHFTLKNLTI